MSNTIMTYEGWSKMKNNVYLIVVVCVLVGAVAGILGCKFLYKQAVEDASNKAVEKVIVALKASYTPGPYAAGFDPDKVNPNLFRQSNQQPHSNQPQAQPHSHSHSHSQWSMPEHDLVVPQAVPQLDPGSWNRQWESSRY